MRALSNPIQQKQIIIIDSQIIVQILKISTRLNAQFKNFKTKLFFKYFPEF